MRLNSTAFLSTLDCISFAFAAPWSYDRRSEADAFDAVEVRYKGPARYLERDRIGVELAVDDEVPDIMLREAGYLHLAMSGGLATSGGAEGLRREANVIGWLGE